MHAAAVGPDGRIYVVGGANVSGGLTSVEVYGPAPSSSTNADTAGSVITLAGNNFAAHANVSVRFGDPMGAVAATGTTDAKGALAPIMLTVPPTSPSGPTRIWFVDDRSRYPVSIPFTVN
jgi:hypothetical protein